MGIELKRENKKEKKEKKKDFGFSTISRAEEKMEGHQAGGECPYCGTIYSATAQICPECGMGVSDERCTFCSASMPEGAEVCPHCGNPSSGIECNECGTINFRSFCRKCGSALNFRATLALERFRADPKYREALRIERQLKKLHDFIEGLTEEVEPEETSEGEGETLDTSALSEMPSEYAALFGQKAQAKKPDSFSQSVNKIKEASARRMSVREAIAAYAEKKAEMDVLLDSIVPPPELSPEEQRDFCSARQIAVTLTYTQTTVINKRWWICNFCGCRHHSPSECAEPWHGGVWIDKSYTETTTYSTTTLETLND